MTINLKLPDATELKPRITVFGVGGAGGNAVNNMIESHLLGVEFVVANTDAQALSQSGAERRIQMGTALTEGLGAGSQPEVGAAAAEEALPEIIDHLAGAHMVFITAGMGGGTGTGAAPVIARAAREQGILTVGVVTKPFQFEGQRRMATAERGIAQLAQHVDTLIVIPNQNLFRIANEKTTFADAFAMADQVLYSGVAGITDLMVKEGLINLDFADVRAIMSEMGKAMMGTGEASGEKRALEAAEAAIANPLLDDVSMKGAKGLLISITGGNDLTLYEVDEAATRIREEVDKDANIILGATFDEQLDGVIRVSVVATGIAADTFVTMPEEDRAGRLAAMNSRRPFVITDRPSFAPAPAAAEAPAARAEETREYQDESYDEPEPMEEARPEPAPEPARPQAAVEQPAEPAPIHYEQPAAPRPQQPVAQEVRAEAAPRQPAPQQPQQSQQPQQPQQAAMAEHRGERREAIAGAGGQRRAPARMPDVDDFPPIAVREMQARAGQKDELGLHAQKKRVGFLERLANVGIGFKEPVVGQTRHREPSVSAQFGADAPRQQPVQQRTERSTLPSPQETGVAHDPDFDEDQLEIPAFLRRQAN